MENFDRQQKEAEQKKRLEENLSRIKNKILVISGKGGVGKTTVAVNLAYGLAQKGYKTGILDVDIHGPNIAKMLGVEDKRSIGSEECIEPVEVTPNLKAISIALLGYDTDEPIIWRGPLKMVVIKQFLGDVNWGDLDYLIIDAPPGTGDEPLSVCQLIPELKGAIVVTTPQDVAILDSRKSVVFAGKLNIPVLGIIENMSGFNCPHCGKEVEFFGAGGGKKAAESLRVSFLGRIPLEPLMVKAGDSGKPFIHFNKDKAPAKAFDEILGKII